jgi:hypothetical protein
VNDRKSVRRKKVFARRWGVESLEARTLLAAPTVIDVMVLYDANAKLALGVNDAQIQKLIRQSIDSANQVHYNTQDNVVLRLVDSEQITFSSSGDFQTDLNTLSGLASVATLRNNRGADLVSLVTTPSSPGNVAGLANLLNVVGGNPNFAFSIIKYNAIGPGQFTIAHEMGHNMGAGHERDNPTEPAVGPFPYSYGYHFTGNDGVEYGDVMSYQGHELPYFANPALSYQGQPLGKPAGDPQSADLFATFAQTATNVASYRASVTTDTNAPSATLYETNLSGNVLKFAVRYQDDISVDGSTLGNGDVTVHTPEGFNLAARLLSLDRAGDGWAKLATYQVVLPDSKPPLSALTFNLNASQVKDVNNNFIPAGAIANNVDYDSDRFEFQLARDTGALTAPGSRRVTGNLGVADTQDFYSFTVSQTTRFNALLTGLGSSADMFLVHDANGDGDFQPFDGVNNNDQIVNSSGTGAADRSLTQTLAPGTYYVLVQLGGGQAPTNYTLTLNAYSDVTPPGTPVLDRVDYNAATSTIDFYVTYSDDQQLDAFSIRNKGYIKVQGPGGGFTVIPIENPNTVIPDAKQITVHYSANFSVSSGTVTISVSNHPGFENLVTDIAGNALPTGTVIGTIRVGGTDTIAPTASAAVAPILVPLSGTFDFLVAYKDNRGIDATTLGNSDILVTGPGGFSQAAQFVGPSTVSPGGAFRYATYRITPPGGAWDWHDDGTYTLSMQSNQVKDTGTLFVAAGAFGSFNVHVPYPGDFNGDDAVNFNDLVLLAQNYNTPGNGVSGGDVNYDGVVDFNDLVSLAQNYNTSMPPNPAAVPDRITLDQTVLAAFGVEVQPAVFEKKSPAKPVFSLAPVKKTPPPQRPLPSPRKTTARA